MIQVEKEDLKLALLHKKDLHILALGSKGHDKSSWKETAVFPERELKGESNWSHILDMYGM